VGLSLADAELLPRAADLARLHAAELPQKDELCGAFCTLLTLRLAGIDGLDQDDVALAAGSALGPEGAGEPLPPGESGRRDYRLELPRSEAARAGTAAGGLVRAVDELSAGRRAAVAVRGPWTPAAVDALLAVAGGEPDAALVLNVATRFFWGSRAGLPELLAYLETGDDGAGPDADWDVGHFVACLGAVAGPRGRLLVIADTYAALGRLGVHLQPRARVAAALRREGMTEGGALLMVPAGRARAVAEALRAAGLEPGVWDNGSVDVRAR
jgi:hypothetical protein